MSEKKILPCPFCRGEAKTFHIPENDEEEMKQHPNWKWNDPGMWVIGCDTEMCMGNIGHFAMIFVTEEDAIKTWNTRKPIEKVVDQLEDLKCKYRKIMSSIPTDCINEKCSDYGCSECAIENAIDIVKQVNFGTDDVCEWKSDYKIISDKYKRVTGCGYEFYDLHHAVPFKHCPYCGKKILCKE